ncbi:MAG: hypothetical protein Q9222_001953 [Ikaeria aurantiellina]
MSLASNALVFARIVPQGPEAEDALDFVCNDENLNDHHRSFIHVHPEPRDRPRDSGSDSSSPNSRPAANHALTGRYFALSLEQPNIQPFSTGWRIGRDAAEVDLLLIKPRKSKREVAPVHARIRLHMRSGVPMLFGVDSSKSVAYRAHDSPHPIYLSKGQGHVLYQKSNSFAVGQLYYTLEFADFSEELHQRFVAQRNTILKVHGLPKPHAGLSAICRHQDTKRGPVITHGTLSTGKFGIVCAAVVATSGEPIAVKQHRADTQHELRLIRHEADVGSQFQLDQGLLPILNQWCEHQFLGVCNSVPQALFTASPLALCDFSGVLWRDHTLYFVRDCFRGPVLGLATLHAAGYMHRDIHIRNLFLMRSTPPEGVLADFGKTIEAETASDDCLGPIHSRAPEVDGRTQYTNKIDVWSLGCVLLKVVDPDVHPPSGEAPSLEWHQSMRQYIDNFKRDEAGTLEADVLDLIQHMLRWSPRDRPAAAQISTHPFFTSNHPCVDGTNTQSVAVPPQAPSQPPTQAARQQLPPSTPGPANRSIPRPTQAPAPSCAPSSSSSSSRPDIPMLAPYGRRPSTTAQAPLQHASPSQRTFRQHPPAQGPPRSTPQGNRALSQYGNESSPESSSSGDFSRENEPWVPLRPEQWGPAYRPPPGPPHNMPPRRW